MRLLLVGRALERARLRAAVEDARFEIVGEFDTVANAQLAGPRADGLLLPSRVNNAITTDAKMRGSGKA